MTTIDNIKNKFSDFLQMEINKISGNHPMIAFVKPVIERIIKGNIDKLDDILHLLADEKGHVDITGILGEMTNSLMTTKPFVTDLGALGELEIGNGTIKMAIPLTNKSIVLNSDDVTRFRQMFL